jgi:3-phenylpropionate/trans-cinnamate dioxygenase ferredoxin reductase subunit
MTTTPGYVIVGASLAGAKGAQALREEGFDGRITLLGDEPNRPYERPPLSKDYLLGKAERDSVFVHPEAWYAEHDVDLRLGVAVTSLDPAAHEITTAAGDRWAYDKLLIATGSTPRRLTIPGADLGGVHYLRRLEDSDHIKIKAAFDRTERVVIVGAGWIGLETAAAARAVGLEVTLLERGELPLLRILGPKVARLFADLHRHHGVDLRCGVQISELTGADGTANGVRLHNGQVIDADMILVGVGITPNSGLAVDAGLDVDNGIVVDEHLRTSKPDIYAAGDVANAYHPRLGRHIRVEHWANARRQAAVAAKAMLGHDATYDRPPYFFSDQYDLGMEYTGYVEPGADHDVLFRGDPNEREFIVFWVEGGRVLAGMNVNNWDAAAPIEELITSGRTVEADRLADPDIRWEQL